MVQTMMSANGHACPGCGWEPIPVWRALCPHCFNIVPWKLRAEFMHAYRRRVLHYRDYQEVLIEVRQWVLAVKTHDQEEEE